MLDSTARTENIGSQIRGYSALSGVTSIAASVAYATRVGAPVGYLLDKASMAMSVKSDHLAYQLKGAAQVGSAVQAVGSIANMGCLTKTSNIATGYSIYSTIKGVFFQTERHNSAIDSYNHGRSPMLGR